MMSNWHSIKKTADYYRMLSFRGAKHDSEGFMEFCRLNNLVKVTSGYVNVVSYERVLQFGRIVRPGWRRSEDERPPYLDHALFLKGRDRKGPVYLVYHPYEDWKEVLKAGKIWAEERKLRISVYDPSKSWYYPGSTCLVVISLQDADSALIP